MITGPLEANETIGFTKDRFKNPNGAIYMNPGYYMLPPGVYFSNSFSFLAWVKVFAFNPWSRVIDCGNGAPSDNFILSLSMSNQAKPYTAILRGNTTTGQAQLPAINPQPINTWFHLASVYDGQYLMLYINGDIVGNMTSNPLLSVNRTQCFIGRSNWHFATGDLDSNACFDDLMLFNRSLSSAEIKDRMNTLFNIVAYSIILSYI